MHFPRYWAQAGETARNRAGETFSLKAWGWSDRSRADAEDRARERLANVSARVRIGEKPERSYAYGSRPLREEIVRELEGEGSEADAIITRNSYGSLVLNTSRAMFIDIDLPEPTIKEGFLGLFGRKGPQPEDRLLETVRRGLASVSGASFRLYRTAAGFRVLATDPLYEPGSEASERIMGAVGSDPAFATLCRLQKSFRARLTPKWWRCGGERPPGTFPRESPEEQRQFADWLQWYESVSRNHATCRLVEEVGWKRIHPETRDIVQVHDQMTRIDSGLPLA
jgi:hypothetical protein